LTEKLNGHEQYLKNLSNIVSTLLKPHDPSFQQLGSKYYYIESLSRVNWFEAHNRCKKLGAHLLNLQSKEEFNLVVGQLKYEHYWIDSNELSKTGDFVSSTTGNRPNFILWHSNEPFGNENCVEIKKVGSEYAMNDNSCNQELYFICE
ncbi:hypothetical protein KR093_001648, partial [Drosophila rubida]